MANYYSKTLSNRVKVKDINKFQEIIENVPADDYVTFETDDKDSTVLFYLDGTLDLEDDDNVIPNIQSLLCDGETLIIKQTGHEKFIYLDANAYIISKGHKRYVDLDDAIEDKVKKMRKVISFKPD